MVTIDVHYGGYHKLKLGWRFWTTLYSTWWR